MTRKKTYYWQHIFWFYQQKFNITRLETYVFDQRLRIWKLRSCKIFKHIELHHLQRTETIVT